MFNKSDDAPNDDVSPGQSGPSSLDEARQALINTVLGQRLTQENVILSAYVNGVLLSSRIESLIAYLREHAVSEEAFNVEFDAIQEREILKFTEKLKNVIAEQPRIQVAGKVN